MRNKTAFFLFLFSAVAVAQTKFYSSKLLLAKSNLSKFYSSISVDSTHVYFCANDYSVYAHDKKTGIVKWSYYSGNKSNDAPKSNQRNVFVETSGGKCEQLNAKTGKLVQTLSLEELSTQPFIKDTIMYCAAVSPQIGGAIVAYDLKNNNVVWQKYIGHGASLQPFFFKEKIVANFEENYWFELDYNGNLLDKDSGCYSKNNEPPFEENYCNVHYDLLNQYNKGVAVKSVSMENMKYYYANEITVVLEEDKIRIIDDKNEIVKEIEISKIFKLPENKTSDYREILKVEGNTIWFFYENTLVAYDFKINKTIKTYNLSAWRPHQVLLDGTKVWLISRNTGELVGLELNKEL
jgi:hypothetical protein